MRKLWTILVLVAAFTSVASSTTGAATGASSTDGAPRPIADSCQADTGSPLTAVGRPLERDRDGDNIELDGTVLISPPRYDVRRALEPGDSFTCELTIRSRRSEPATYRLTPLGVVGSDSPRAGFEYVDSTDERWAGTAGGWITPKVPEVIIPPRGIVTVPFTVRVPDEPPAGSANGAIGVVSRARASAGDTNLGVESVVASIIFIPTSTDAAPDLELLDVDPPRLRWNREAWPFSATLANDGDLYATASGRVRIRSIFGNEVASLPIPAETVFPDGREPVDIEWDRVPWLGIYRWDARIAGGPPGSTDEATRSVAVLDGWFVALPPWWVLAIAGALLLVLLVRWLHARAMRWGDLADADDGDLDSHDPHDGDDFDFDLAERQLRD